MAKRFGTFSSSMIYRIMGAGKREMTAEELAEHKKENPKSRAKLTTCINTPDGPFDTAVEEKYREHKLKRAITNDSTARSLIWGKICERYVFEHRLGMEWADMNSRKRLVNPNNELHTGIPDTERVKDGKKRTGDIKSPYTLTAYCELIENLEKGLEAFKDNHKDYYYQLVSNAELSKASAGDLIIFVPEEEELDKFCDFVYNFDGDEELSPFLIEWVYHEVNAFLEAKEEGREIEPKFPYLPTGSLYNSLSVYEVDFPEQDLKNLRTRIEMATKAVKDKIKAINGK